MIKNYQQFVNEDLRSKKITLEPQCDNLQKLYPNIKVNYGDDLKIVISYNEDTLRLDKEFYEALEKDNIKIEDIIFENCEKISLYEINNFKKISDYGKFETINGNFYCSYCNNLQSLNGCPKEVGGYFNCSYCNNLQSLEGAPEKVNGDFYCSHCDNLQSLEGCPKEVGGYFSCSYCNNLQSLEGCPEKVGGSFICNGCNNLQSLEFAPKEVDGYFSCSSCKNLQSLEGAPEKVGGYFNCKECSLDFIELAKQKYGDKCIY